MVKHGSLLEFLELLYVKSGPQGHMEKIYYSRTVLFGSHSDYDRSSSDRSRLKKGGEITFWPYVTLGIKKISKKVLQSNSSCETES